MSRVKKSQAEYLQGIKDEWREAGNPWPAPIKTIIRWAIDTDRIPTEKQSLVDYWAGKMQAALREETYVDPQGRRVRKNHCYPEVTTSPSGIVSQTYLWCDHETAIPDQMRACVTYRRDKIVAEGVQLKTDVDSYNDNNRHGVHIQLELNLTHDVEEQMHGFDGDYNP